MTEYQFSIKVKKFIESGLTQSSFSSIKVKEKVNILNTLTVGKVQEDWKIIFGFLEQDIVLYQDEIDITELKSNKILIPRGTKDKKIIIPLAVLELKIGESLNTHHFITYSHIAKELKSVFPHCTYYFVSGGQKRKFAAETLLRHTKEFNRVYLNWEKDKNKMLKELLAHFEYLEGLSILKKK